MGMHVFSYLKNTLRRKDKSRDSDWDFGARQSPDGCSPVVDINVTNSRRRRSSSPDRPSPQTESRSLVLPWQKRVSAAFLGDPHGSANDVRVRSSRVANARSASPEDEVLLAAGQSAKESRRPADYRRRVLSVSVTAARTTDLPRPVLRHANSASFTPRDFAPPPTSPTSLTSLRPAAPAAQSRRESITGAADGGRRATLLASKRSMPQLHNVWENFLEEAAANADSFDFPMPPRSPPQSPAKFAAMPNSSRASSTGSSLPRHIHSHTTSASSVPTTPPQRVKGLPSSPSCELGRQQPRRDLRASHQASSSTSSATTSNEGSTSSMAGFSSASSMTTAYDECDDSLPLLGRDDPAPSIPRSSPALSLNSFKFTDPALSPPASVRRLRKSPTSPALQCQTVPRSVSPTSSTSTDSLVSSTVSQSHSHSQSTTPTPSSACPTPSPRTSRPPLTSSDKTDQLSPVVARVSCQFRRSPTVDEEVFDQVYPLSPGSAKGRRSLSSIYRNSSATLGSRPVVESVEGDDILSNLGYYGSTSSRAKAPRSAVPCSPTSPKTTIVPPLRRASRQNLRVILGAGQSAPAASSAYCHAPTLPRAKSASNIRHEGRAPIERPRITTPGTLPSNSLQFKDHRAAPDSSSSGYLHSRSQTLQDGQLASPSVLTPTASPWTGQARFRSSSTSLVPPRPPPAPPLDMTPSRLHPPVGMVESGSGSTSPLTPVQWGYAL